MGDIGILMIMIEVILACAVIGAVIYVRRLAKRDKAAAERRDDQSAN